MAMDNVTTFDEIAARIPKINQDSGIILFETGTEFTVPPLNPPLKFDALLLVLCKSGEGEIGIDLCEYEFRPGSLIVISPKSYLSMFRPRTNTHFSVLVVAKSAIEGMLPKLTDLLPYMIAGKTDCVTNLSPETTDQLSYFYGFIHKKLTGPRTPFRRQKLLCLLQTIFYELFDLDATMEQTKPKTRKEEIMANFIIQVCNNFKQNRQVSFYADRLFITPKHLSSVVKEISGRTAGEWIENYVIMEAKVLLKTTDLTIQEIAARMNFKNQSFFGKYFRHITGVSPTQYRNNI